MSERIQSRLELRKIGIEHIEFTRELHRGFEGEMRMDFSVQYLESEPGPSEAERGVRLRLEMIGETDGNRVIYLDLVMVATFVIHEKTPEVFEVLFKKNTLALMLPYIRSEVTLITSQPGTSPILLPAIDVNELYNGLVGVEA